MTKFTTTMKAMLAGTSLAVLLGSGAYAQIDTAINVARQSTAQAAQAQQTIDSADDAADSAVREYRAVLQQIESLNLAIAQQDVFLKSRQDEIDSLNEQLGRVEEVKQSVQPMMFDMALALQNFIETDLPFNQGERLARIDRINETLESPDFTTADVYRQILNAYDIELSLGQQLKTWKGAHPTDANGQVDYIRYGRLAYLYMTADESEIKIWDMDADAWVDVPTSYAPQLRQAIRVAADQAAPTLLSVPIIK